MFELISIGVTALVAAYCLVNIIKVVVHVLDYLNVLDHVINFFKSNAFLFIFRLTWNVSVISLAIGLTIGLNVFIWGSVIVGILLLCFAPIMAFIFPLFLIRFTTELWPERYELAHINEQAIF